MKDHSTERTMAENEERLNRLKPMNSKILLLSYVVAGIFFFNLWGWLGILAAVPVGMLAGVIIASIVGRVLYIKK